MEATHEHGHAQHEAEHKHEHDHEHGHDQHGAQQSGRPHEDWSNDEFVAYWINEQEGRAEERHRQFVRVRALLPKEPDQEFRYLNLGAGPGSLDEMLLDQFHGAQATLVDGSLAMLAEARNRLERFGDRVEFVQANLATHDWTNAVKGPFDVVVSTIALHNLGNPSRLRQLYTESYELLGHGGLFLNLDYVRVAHPSLAPLAAWAAKDPEAGFGRARGGTGLPGTVEEQLGWLHEAGFPTAECFWKEFQVALMLGVRDHIHMPAGAEATAPAAAGHAHEHHEHH
jgi:hypothetical protein